MQSPFHAYATARILEQSADDVKIRYEDVLTEEATIRNYRIVRTEGCCQISHIVEHGNFYTPRPYRSNSCLRSFQSGMNIARKS